MEEFWKNIRIASFHDQRSDYLSTATHHASRAIILQDFLAQQFSDNSPPSVSAPRSSAKKRSRETGDSSIDQKHQRLMKNRESAARSRARKHDYTNKLEIEVARLQAENAELRRQQERMCVAATPQLPQEKNLYRTLTAPF